MTENNTFSADRNAGAYQGGVEYQTGTLGSEGGRLANEWSASTRFAIPDKERWDYDPEEQEAEEVIIDLMFSEAKYRRFRHRIKNRTQCGQRQAGVLTDGSMGDEYS